MVDKFRFVQIGRLAFALLLLAALPAQTSANQVVYAVIGDFGTGKKSQFAVAHQMELQREKFGFDFVITVGDNIYPDGHPRLFESRFEEPYRALLDAGVKFYASLGNHDVRRGREAQSSYEKFNMGGNPYYSIRKGADPTAGGMPLVELFALDTTRMTPAQVKWLERSLAASRARWKVVYMHHPLYSSSRRHGSSMRLRRLLEPVLVRHRVDVVFAGHDHAYERIRPMHGVQHFVAGAGGKLRRGGLNRTSRLMAAGNDQMNSFLIVQAGAAEKSVKAIGVDGSVLDRLVMHKPAGQPRPPASRQRPATAPAPP